MPRTNQGGIFFLNEFFGSYSKLYVFEKPVVPFLFISGAPWLTHMFACSPTDGIASKSDKLSAHFAPFAQADMAKA